MTTPLDLAANDYLQILAERDLLPADREAIYLGGSLVRGWGNEGSDVDIYIVTSSPWNGEYDDPVPVSVAPGNIFVKIFYIGDRRWDVEYWTDKQTDELLDLVSWGSFEAGRSAMDTITSAETDYIERLIHCRAVDGEAWIHRRRQQFESSAAKAIVCNRCLYMLDALAEDAVGMLDGGDAESAVLATRLAFGYAVDALLANHGEIASAPKWRFQRMKAARPSALSVEDYWDIETMRSYDSRAPEKWVEHALLACRKIAEAVQL